MKLIWTTTIFITRLTAADSQSIYRKKEPLKPIVTISKLNRHVYSLKLFNS